MLWQCKNKSGFLPKQERGCRKSYHATFSSVCQMHVVQILIIQFFYFFFAIPAIQCLTETGFKYIWQQSCMYHLRLILQKTETQLLFKNWCQMLQNKLSSKIPVSDNELPAHHTRRIADGPVNQV